MRWGLLSLLQIFELDDDGTCQLCGADEGDHLGKNKVCPAYYTFLPSVEDENKCDYCDKLKEHHHTKKRDGTISNSEFCYDFLLDATAS